MIICEYEALVNNMTIILEQEVFMANIDIREIAKKRGVRLWQIAERYGVTDGNFSRKLRRELPDAEKQKILRIISELSIKEA